MRVQIRKWIGFAFCCGATCASAADYLGAWNFSHFSTPVRVLLESSQQSVLLRSMKSSTVRINGSPSSAKLSPGQLFFSAEDSKVRLVRIPYRPLTAKTFELVFPLEAAGFEWNGRMYRGRAFVAAENGTVFVTNQLPMETYLAGTVGSEMSPSWSVEALKAQAVAARSYALYRRERPRHPLYDLESSTQDQVYLGVSSEKPSVWRAVKETAGVYLVSNGKPSQIHYHSRCGGQTQTPDRVWGSAKSGNSVDCPFCRQFPYKWNASWTPEEFLEKLGMHSQHPKAVLVVRQSSEGRVHEVEVAAGTQKRTVSSETLRRLLGYNRLKSTHFALSQSSHSIRAEGTGAGHGVGMCQWGAKYLADQGAGYSDILKHYYPGRRLARLPSEKGMDRSQVAKVGYARAPTRRLRFSSTGTADSAFPRFTP